MMVGCFVTGSVCLELILWNSLPLRHCNLGAGGGESGGRKTLNEENLQRKIHEKEKVHSHTRTRKRSRTCASILLQSTRRSSRSSIHPYSSNYSDVPSVASHHANHSWGSADRTRRHLRGDRGNILPWNQTHDAPAQRTVSRAGT